MVDDAHSCEALTNGHKFCKHTVARRLMTRYVERLGASEATGAPKTVRKWQIGVVETKRASLLAATAIALLRPPTLRGEMCNGIDV